MFFSVKTAEPLFRLDAGYVQPLKRLPDGSVVQLKPDGTFPSAKIAPLGAKVPLTRTGVVQPSVLGKGYSEAELRAVGSNPRGNLSGDDLITLVTMYRNAVSQQATVVWIDDSTRSIGFGKLGISKFDSRKFTPKSGQIVMGGISSGEKTSGTKIYPALL